tara:strand:- start:43 stop:528 length:486 start_codon:yes stop_codon:yes gene_type:complete
MKKISICIGIFLALSMSRFIPHPPNFTSLIALSFYVPALFGFRYLPALLISFVITDYIIGFHNTVFFTWGSVIIIAIISKYFANSILTRISGALTGAVIFFLITNFGVWFGGMYQPNLQGLTESYIMGLPFFGYSLISTFIFSTLIETIYKFTKYRLSILE